MYKYNELAYAEYILEKGFSSKYLNTELRVLAKYYKHQGHKPKECEELLYKFCEEKIEKFSKVKYFKKVNAALSHARKKENKLIIIDEIPVTKSELEYIDQIQIDNTYRKLLFTLLVSDKLNKKVQLTKDGKITNEEHYFGGSDKRYKELVATSKIPTGKGTKNIHNIIGEFAKQELVEIRNNGLIKLLFMYEIPRDEEIIIVVKDFESIGYYYDLHIGENKIKKCESCEVPVKAKSNRTKYCEGCWKERELERKRKVWHKIKTNKVD